MDNRVVGSQADIIQVIHGGLETHTEQELDDIYRNVWRRIKGFIDTQSEEYEEHWALIIEIEELRAYEPGEVNTIRFDQE